MLDHEKAEAYLRDVDARFSCPKCGQNLVVDAVASGLTLPCPTCGKTLLIPQPETTPAPEQTKPAVRYYQAKDLWRIAKAWADANGYSMTAGSYIRDSNGVILCQGYNSLATRLETGTHPVIRRNEHGWYVDPKHSLNVEPPDS